MRYVLLGLALIAAPAQAANHSDSRIAQREYDPDRVVTLAGHRGVQTMIELAGDEIIENIALGDSAAWQVTPNKRANLVFVKPLIARARTNMTVVTDRRRYLFELYQGNDRAPPLYSLRFTYPAEALPELLQVAAPPAPKPVPPPPVLNRDWHASGNPRLIPAAIHDDGVSTFIAWPPQVEIPAILTQGPDGSEGAVNFTVKGDTLVVDGVAQRYILHLGKASAVLTNGSPRRPDVGPDVGPALARQEGAQ
jgi:type IV secretion system protein VirB9